MGLFSQSKSNRKLRRAKNEVKNNLSPVSAASLINAYISAGEIDNALYVARQAQDLFPRSATMLDTIQRLNNIKYNEEIRSLQSEISQKPNPITYARLADLFYSMGENDKALEVCLIGSEKFPDYEGNYLIVGKLRYQRWKKDGLAADGKLAVEFFEKALDLNPENYKTMLQLAEIYLQIGAVEEGKKKLKGVLHATPDDQRANQLINYAKNLPPLPEMPLEDLFNLAEQRRQANLLEFEKDTPDGWALSRFAGDFSQISALIQETFSSLQGFLGAALFKKTGEFITSIRNYEVDEDVFATALQEVLATGQDLSCRLDIGSIDSASIQTSAFILQLFVFGHLAFVIMAMPDVKQETLNAMVNNFIDRELYVDISEGR